MAETQVLATKPEKANGYTERLWEIYTAAPEDAIIYQIASLDFDETAERRRENESNDFIDFAADHLK